MDNVPLYEAKADLFRRLGHPVRIRVLELLQDGPRPVSELLSEIDVEASSLSHQLGVLRRAGRRGPHAKAPPCCTGWPRPTWPNSSCTDAGSSLPSVPSSKAFSPISVTRRTRCEPRERNQTCA